MGTGSYFPSAGRLELCKTVSVRVCHSTPPTFVLCALLLFFFPYSNIPLLTYLSLFWVNAVVLWLVSCHTVADLHLLGDVQPYVNIFALSVSMSLQVFHAGDL